MNVKMMMMAGFSLLLTACSQDDSLTTVPDNGSGDTGETEIVVKSGVQNIPLTVVKGTKNVRVTYTAGGNAEQMDVPFVQTSASLDGSAMVSGYARLYSESPATVNVINGKLTAASGVQLTGRVTKRGHHDDNDGLAPAYFFVRLDNTVPGVGESEASNLYYPNDNGASVFNNTNLGYIQTDISKIDEFKGTGVDWHEGRPGTHILKYIFSSNGSLTAPIVKAEPAFLKDFRLANGEKVDWDKYKVVWYVAKLQNDHYNNIPLYHVDGVITKKKTTNAGGNGDGNFDHNDTIPTVKPNPDVDLNEDGIYHDAGVLMYEMGEMGNDVSVDYNDLVVDYDVEARLPKDGNFPYIKLNMHLRALSCKSLDKLTVNLDGLGDKYLAKSDDMHITIHGLAIDDYEEAIKEIPASIVNGCTLKGEVAHNGGNTSISVSGLQWLLSNGTPGWYDLDGQGYYNVTQQSFNGKPFATLSVTLYPKTTDSEADVEQAIANVIDVVKDSFTFDGKKGQYVIAPALTPHVQEGSTAAEAFPGFPNGKWWEKYDDSKVVDPHKSYK